MAENDLKHCICLLGGSAGSLEVLLDFLPQVSSLSCALVIVLHRRGTDDELLEELFSLRLPFPVCEVNDKTPLEPGKVYIAPADYHLLFEKDYTLSLDVSEKVNFSRPSIDVSFLSAADAFGGKIRALILSGANADGTEGLAAIKAAGGLTAVQDPGSAIVNIMPSNAINYVDPDYIIKPEEMPEFIENRLTDFKK